MYVKQSNSGFISMSIKSIVRVWVILICANALLIASDKQEKGKELTVFSDSKKIATAAINNPLDLYQTCSTLYKVFLLEFQNKASKPPRKTMEEIYQLEQQIRGNFNELCPVFMLRECEDKECPLSRFINPSNREQYTGKVAKIILESATDLRPICYVSCGAGGFFQDFVNVSKFCSEILVQSNRCVVSINLIDPGYRDYLAFTKDQQEGAQGERTDFTKKNDCIRNNTNIQLPNITNIEERLFCFLKFLRSNYPSLDFDCTLYGSVQDFLSKTVSSDARYFFTGCDLNTVEALKAYQQLLSFAEKKKLNAQGILLCCCK